MAVPVPESSTATVIGNGHWQWHDVQHARHSAGQWPWLIGG